jgi:hypothetical protein
MDIILRNRDKIIAILQEGACPICGKKGFKRPLTHVSHVHGISHAQLKDAIMLGRHHGFIDAELLEKMRKIAVKKNLGSNLNRVPRSKINYTEEMLKKRSYVAKTTKTTKNEEAVKQFVQSRKKAVVRISKNGERVVYDSLTDAARENNVTRGAIGNCVNGKKKTCKGYKWEAK